MPEGRVRGFAGNDAGASRSHLAKTAADERVRSVCLIAVLDRAGVIKPIDFDPASEAKEQPRFNPRVYSREQLAQIKAVLEL